MHVHLQHCLYYFVRIKSLLDYNVYMIICLCCVSVCPSIWFNIKILNNYAPYCIMLYGLLNMKLSNGVCGKQNSYSSLMTILTQLK